MTLLAIGVAFALRQGNADIGIHREIHLRNYDKMVWNEKTGTYEVSGNGNPISVEDTVLGLKMQAHSMTCTLAKNAAGKLVVTKAVMDGDAHIWVDSLEASKAQAAIAAEEHLKPPPVAPQVSRMHLAAGHIDYSVGPAETIAVLTRSVYYSDHGEGHVSKNQAGKPSRIFYIQDLHVTGTAGRIALEAPLATEQTEIRPKTVHLDGPVSFDLQRTETPDPPISTGKPAVTTVKGSGDQFDGDFAALPDPTLTLAGNVAVDGNATGFAGTTKANQATVTLDRDTKKPMQYEFLGQPAVTTVKPPARSGGKTP